jgi:hypothetical protein
MAQAWGVVSYRANWATSTTEIPLIIPTAYRQTLTITRRSVIVVEQLEN